MTRNAVLITGASSGIGAASVRRMAARGWTVYAAARRLDRLAALERANVHPLPLDLTDDASICAAVDDLASDGGVSAIVNNAGYGSYGAVEDVPLAEARRQFEVNLFGAARLIQLALPQLRRAERPRIVNISSVGGRIHEPFGAWYHATKFALEGFSDCLRMELKPFGIDVCVVQPGGIRTEWGGIARDSLLASSGTGVYAPWARRHAGMLDNTQAAGWLSDPDVIARAIEQALTARHPRTRYATGAGARPLLLLRSLLSDRLFDAMMWRGSQAQRNSGFDLWPATAPSPLPQP
ncbi:oxidoreductase [Sandarakinorhabdus oryzae]|uniref:oxidoreductase n=1 Tax=Sandarakinorhabdus oryzae TaxID=2675220 RepID=UPI0012E0FC5E|nr:oxidoreductase [Sandarakinorhabdus oryzae]